MRTTVRAPRRTLTAAALAACTVGALLAGSSPASAGAAADSAEAVAAYRITGLELRTATDPRGGPNHERVKTVSVACPAGKVVLGGNVVPREYNDNGYPVFIDDSQLALTQSEPVPLLDGRYTWTAKVAETSIGTPRRWDLRVTAICADPPPRYDLESGHTDVSTDPVQETHADCVGGRTVLGGGARVRSLAENPRVSLQVNRVDALGGLMRAQAAAHPGTRPQPPDWGLTSVVICADRPSGWEIVNAVSPVDPSDQTEVARPHCTIGRTPLSPGGALSTPVNGRAGLTEVTTAVVRGVEHFQANDSWRPVLARMICAHADRETG